MSQTIERVGEILNKIEFRDWRFRTTTCLDGCFLQVYFLAADAQTSEPDIQYGRKWYISSHATKSEIVQTALKAVLTALEHEAREEFLYRGKAIFGPHFQVDDLVEQMPSIELRSSPAS